MSHAAVYVHDTRPFFQSVSASVRRVLLIDYDGTISPFHADRSLAVPYPGIAELLDRIMKTCGTRLVVLTGGSAARIQPLLGIDPPAETWGAYGLERMYPDGRYEGVEITDEAFDSLAKAELFLTEQKLGRYLEITPGGVAVHWRGLASQEIFEVRTAAYRIINPLAVPHGLVVAEFDGGVEIRVPSASAGDAVRSILMDTEPDTPIAYLGDDRPDEDAFRVLNGRGLTALVRAKYRFTAAEFWLRPPDDLVEFLTAWIHACGGTV